VKRLIASVLLCTLLTACASKPNGDLDGSDCAPSGDVGEFFKGGGNPLVDLAALLVVDVTWFAGCEAVVVIANGIHHFQLAYSHNGIYTSPDDSFSVGVPLASSDEYQAQQQIADGKDTVVFVPRTPGEPVYGVTVLTHLDDAQAGSSLTEFSNQASAGLSGIGVPVEQIRAEDVQLGANPARLVVYRSKAAGTSAPDYYLMYFVKTAHSAAILSITWPYDCPYCTTGSEAAIRSMDPALGSFLDSFELASQTR
jgi:hypothetical protein